jgi:hypothetical protein
VPIRRPAPIAFALLTVAALLPAPALAAGGGVDAGTLATVLFLVAAVGGAYLMTHFVVDWLQRAFLVSTSVEYLLLGLLVGLFLQPGSRDAIPAAGSPAEHAAGFIAWPDPLDDLTVLAPLIALAAGWTGLIYGMTLRLSTLFEHRDGALRLAVVEGLLTAIPVAFAAWGLMRVSMPSVTDEPGASVLMLCAGVLGVTAWAGSTSAMDVVRRRYKVDGAVLSMLVRGARFGDLIAILAFGTLFAVFHGVAVPSLPSDAPVYRLPTPVEWVVITIGLGLALGALFAWFLDEDDSDTGALLALTGIIAFASGAAFFLDLSGLTINMILGLTLINISGAGDKVRRSIEGTYRPITLLLLLLAGALWTPPPWLLTVLLTLVVLGVRLGGKILSGLVASIGTDIRRDVFRGVIGQGDVAIAMAVSFKLVYDVARGPEVFDAAARGTIDATYTAILVGVVIHEIVAPRMLKGLLVDAGEIRAETGPGG